MIKNNKGQMQIFCCHPACPDFFGDEGEICQERLQVTI
jgi:hypothetical protein